MEINNNKMLQNSAGTVNFNTHFTEFFLLDEAFKTLRSNLLFCGSDIKTIVVISSLENEGKTTISTELAKSLSKTESKTLLIYGDMRKPYRAVKIHQMKGLSELLSGQAELSQVIYNTQSPYFDVIFSGEIPENPTELLSGETFAESLGVLKEQYDHIIIDSPPLIPVIDASLISVHCDGAVLVIAAERATVQEISASKTQLQRSHCKVLGAILNQTHDSMQSKYYGKKYSSYYNKRK